MNNGEKTILHTQTKEMRHEVLSGRGFGSR